jgi:hypothetical protein
MFEQGGGGRRRCLTFQLWIKGVYHVDNFWLVDKSKNEKLSTGCPHRNAANQSVTPAPILAFNFGPRRVLLVHILLIRMELVYSRRQHLDQ